jgi:hypothetical protein
LRNLIKRSSPEINADQLEHVITYIKEKHANDPLALLQPVKPGEEGAQLQTIKTFNLELALFLAQLTGSMIYTDVLLHWQHLHAHTSAATEPKVTLVWKPLVERIQTTSFILEANPQVVLQLRMAGKLDDIRSIFRKVANLIRTQDEKAAEQFARDFHSAENNMRREWQAFCPTSVMSLRFQGYMEISLPDGGFERNTVRRLLLTYGRAKQVRGMPMAMFVRAESAN